MISTSRLGWKWVYRDSRCANMHLRFVTGHPVSVLLLSLPQRLANQPELRTATEDEESNNEESEAELSDPGSPTS